jgi:hypothetical protein
MKMKSLSDIVSARKNDECKTIELSLEEIESRLADMSKANSVKPITTRLDFGTSSINESSS